MTISDRPLGIARVLAYSCGSVGTGLFSAAPAVMLLIYMTDTLGVPSALAGLAVMGPKLADVLLDPVFGVASDRTRSRWGRRRPWMLAGALLLPAAFALLFAAPRGEPMLSFWWVFIVYGLAGAAYAIFSVPYVTVPSEISRDTHERTRLMAFRSAFVMIGVLLGSALPPIMVERMGGGVAGYAGVGVTLAVICLAAMLAPLAALRGVKLLEPDAGAHPAVLASMKAVFADPDFRWLTLIHILQLFAVGMTMAAVPFVAVYALGGGKSLGGVFLLLMLGSAILAMPLWATLCRRLGKSSAFALGALIFSLSMLLLWLVPTHAPRMFTAIAVLAGVGFAAVQMVPYAMLTDIVYGHGRRHGFGSEGAFTGWWTAAEKVGLAIAPFATGLIIQASGFISSLEGQVAQPPAVRDAVLFAAGACPALIILVSLWPLRQIGKPPQAGSSNREQGESHGVA